MKIGKKLLLMVIFIVYYGIIITYKKYYLWCKDFTYNFSPQEVKMTNKVFREKSDCVVC